MKRRGDWVLNNGTWQSPLQAASGDQQPGEFLNLGFFSANTLTIARANPSVRSFGVPELSDSMTAVSTRGHIHWHWEPAPQQASYNQLWDTYWRAYISFRITRWPLDADGVTPGDIVGYNLMNIPGGNDNFVWERQVQLINLPTDDWFGAAGARARLSGTIPVVANYQRRLEELECMALLVQFTQGVAPADTIWVDVAQQLRVRYVMKLRTYVHSNV